MTGVTGAEEGHYGHKADGPRGHPRIPCRESKTAPPCATEIRTVHGIPPEPYHTCASGPTTSEFHRLFHRDGVEVSGVTQCVWRGAVFDFDGVLVDSAEVYRQALSELVAPVARSEWLKLYGMTTVQAVHHATQEAWPDQQAEEIAARIDRRVAQLLAAAPPARQGARETLDLLKQQNLPMAVASSASRQAIVGTLEALGWRHYFGAIIGREDALCTKPAPDPYRAAAQHLDLAPGTCFALEDTDIGIRSAHDAGLFTIALGGTQTVDELRIADLYYDDFAGLMEGEWFRSLLQGNGAG